MSKRIPHLITSFEHNYYLDEDVFKMANRFEQENKQLKKKYENAVSDYEQEHYKVAKAIEYMEKEGLQYFEKDLYYILTGEKE